MSHDFFLGSLLTSAPTEGKGKINQSQLAVDVSLPNSGSTRGFVDSIFYFGRGRLATGSGTRRHDKKLGGSSKKREREPGTCKKKYMLFISSERSLLAS